HLLKRDRAHERRHDERHDGERLRDAAPGKVRAGEEQRERQRDHAAQHHGGHAGDERVDERLDEEPALEERGEVREREALRRRDGDDEDSREWIRDEENEKREDRGEERELPGSPGDQHISQSPYVPRIGLPSAKRESRKVLTSSSGFLPSAMSFATISPMAGDSLNPWPEKPAATWKPSGPVASMTGCQSGVTSKQPAYALVTAARSSTG